MYSYASSGFAIVIIFYVLIFLFSIAAQVLLACAAYQDAKSLNNKDATMWAVLIGLLGLIPGIIYLCIRKNNSNSVSSVQQICIGCRAPIAAGTNICPYCGAQQPPMNPYLAAGDGRAENEFRVGEQVNYQVTVNNLQKGSIARNLVISDLSLPEGLALDGGEDAVTVSGVPAFNQNPVS